jgi:hypothetical protein
MQTRTIVRHFTDLGDLDDFGWSLDGQQFLMLDHQGVLTVWGE